ncbi:hypothetical protein [Escherichia coli]|uniref:hypothetical protein n=1 Tax=Escherichia coli TaxID=562 RepID=UPI0018D57190|nr:hypothetical protein [Escherichia coli]
MHKPLRRYLVCPVPIGNTVQAQILLSTPGTILSKANYRNQIKTAGLLDVPLRHHLPALIA